MKNNCTNYLNVLISELEKPYHRLIKNLILGKIKIDCWTLNELIHEYHDKTQRDLYKDLLCPQIMPLRSRSSAQKH